MPVKHVDNMPFKHVDNMPFKHVVHHASQTRR